MAIVTSPSRASPLLQMYAIIVEASWLAIGCAAPTGLMAYIRQIRNAQA